MNFLQHGQNQESPSTWLDSRIILPNLSKWAISLYPTPQMIRNHFEIWSLTSLSSSREDYFRDVEEDTTKTFSRIQLNLLNVPPFFSSLKLILNSLTKKHFKMKLINRSENTTSLKKTKNSLCKQITHTETKKPSTRADSRSSKILPPPLR